MLAVRKRSSVVTFARLRAVATAMLAVAVLGAAACPTDDDDEGTVVGTYTLTGVSVGTAPVFVDPTTVEYDKSGQTYGFKRGSLELNDNGTFDLDVIGTQRPVGSPASSATEIPLHARAGNYTESGSTITFDPTVDPALPNFTGTKEGSQIRVEAVIDGTTYRLRFERD